MSMYQFTTNVLKQHGMKLLLGQTKRLQPKPIPYLVGVLVRLDGLNLQKEDIIELTQIAKFHKIVPILEGTNAYFIDETFYRKHLINLLYLARKWDEHPDYLQENEGIVSLVQRYWTIINQLHQIISMSHKSITIEDTFDSLTKSLSQYEGLLLEFYLNHHRTFKNEGDDKPYSYVVEEMDKEFKELQSILLLDSGRG